MAESVLPSGFAVGFNPSVISAIQDRTLDRVFRDALYPRILYRGEADPDLWNGNLGTNQTFTRKGLMRPSTRPLPAGQDPTPKAYSIEQWEATSAQYGDAIDTHMATSHVSLASQYLANVAQLGLQSGQSLNRSVRDKLINAYVGGNTVVSATTGAGVSLPVVSLAGFTRKLLNGRPAPISAANPLPIVVIIGGIPTPFNAIAFAPTFPGDEIHGGVLTLDVAHAGVTARDPVLAGNRSQVVNVGGASSIDGITSGDTLDLHSIRAAVAQMRTNNVPEHEDGKYHCHLSPTAENQVFGDPEFQRLNRSLPDYIHYREFALAELLGTVFYRNAEAPTQATVDQDPAYGFTFAHELVNVPGVGDPVPIQRTIITGMGAVEEKYLDEAKYISEAGVIGKIGEFAVVNNGIQVMTDRIRLIMRAPLDRLQQLTSTAWSWSGDWAIPTDAGALSSPADFKRAVVIQHGS